MKNNWQTKILGEISKEQIKEKIRVALGLLFKSDCFLLDNSVHERSIAHKLAEYLQQQFPDWHVDCEYNKHKIFAKKLLRECKGENKEWVYPDINIHHRNTDDNLVVFEIKPNKSNVVNKCDHVKLIEFTKNDGDYKYSFGVFVGFDSLNEPQIVFYRDGEIVEL